MDYTQDEHESAFELGMTVDEYRKYLSTEINFIEDKLRSDIFENKYHAEITYTYEREFINLNLQEIQNFLGIGNIKPMGKYAIEIMSDAIYRGIPNISKDVVNEIMLNYKIIDIHNIFNSYKHEPNNNQNRDVHVSINCTCTSHSNNI